MRTFLAAMLFTTAFGLVAYATVVSVHQAAQPQRFVYQGTILGFPLTIEGEVDKAELKKFIDRYPAFEK